MSAINEALKKARDQNPATTTTATGNNGFHLIPNAKKYSISHFYLGLSLAFAAVLVGLGIYLMRGDGSLVVNAEPVRTPASASDSDSVQQQASIASPPALSGSQEIETSTGENEDLPEAPSVLEPNVPAIPPPSSATTPEPSVAIAGSVSAYPSLRLQGIFYRKGDAFVILNSETLAVGDEVNDVTVTKITPDSVVLRWNNEIKTLTLR